MRISLVRSQCNYVSHITAVIERDVFIQDFVSYVFREGKKKEFNTKRIKVETVKVIS